MFHLVYISTTFWSLKFSPLFVGKGSHSSIPIPPDPQSNQALKELQS